MPWYKTGTVSVTLNSNAVIGTGTSFIANSRVGDAFKGPDGGWYEITNIASDTAMSILPTYKGATTGAGGYALAPLQGYVKDSADALRAIVNAYGTKLAALGTTGNYDSLPVNKGGTGGATQGDARAGLGLGSVATDNIVPVVRGGTGGSTQAAARTGLGLKSAAIADIVGTVSQTGGVPTGAIMQSGSNANGSYIKYADGTMECRHILRMSSVLTASILGGTWAYPMPFIDASVVVSHSPMQGSSADATPLLVDRFNAMLTPSSASGISVRLISSGAYWLSGDFVDTHLIAKGRWFA